MKTYDKACSARRRNHNEGIARLVAIAIKDGPKTSKQIEVSTGLDNNDTRLGINWLHTKGGVSYQGGLWWTENTAA